MARTDTPTAAPSKTDMIQEVLRDRIDLSSAEVRLAVWERFALEVTTQEIAQARKKLRQAATASEEPKTRVAPRKRAEKPVASAALVVPDAARETAPSASKSRSAARKKPVRSRDFATAAVTVQQLSLILEVAEKFGGLRKLHDALRTVLALREHLGPIDEEQLGIAIEFLVRLTGKSN